MTGEPHEFPEPVPGIRNHQHIHKLLIPSDDIFDYDNEIKVIRSTMYEPVMDRCVTTTIIKSNQRPSKSLSVGKYENDNGPEPPDKPPRRRSKLLRQQTSRSDNQDEDQKMRQEPGDHVAVPMQNGPKGKPVDASAQTLPITPYRLRFLPSCSCDAKFGPSETSCMPRLGCCCRLLCRWLLSQVGLGAVVSVWALLGAWAFYSTEGPREFEQSGKLASIQKDLSVELSDDLLLISAQDDEDARRDVIHRYLERHERLFLDAVGAGYGEGGGGTIWTYPGCLLFAVSLLTTLGFGAPVPRTALGRSSTVVFAAVGIPLHFLLILNVGHLGAGKLQQLAGAGRDCVAAAAAKPAWLKCFPFVSVFFYYILGVVIFGVLRRRPPVDSLMFPLDFTAAGGVATVAGQTRVFYALYLEAAVTLAAVVVSLLQASASRGIVDVGLKLGVLTNS